MCVKWRACAAAAAAARPPTRGVRGRAGSLSRLLRLLVQHHTLHYADEDHLEAMPVLILSGLRNSLLQVLQTQCDQN